MPMIIIAADSTQSSKSLLHFNKFFVNANFSLVKNYCPNGNVLDFSHTSQIGLHFSITNTLNNAIQTSEEEKTQTIPSVGDVDPSNTPIPWPTPLTAPNGSFIASLTISQLHNKVPIGYNETPTSTLKIVPSCGAIATKSTCLILEPSRPTIQNDAHWSS